MSSKRDKIVGSQYNGFITICTVVAVSSPVQIVQPQRLQEIQGLIPKATHESNPLMKVDRYVFRFTLTRVFNTGYLEMVYVAVEYRIPDIYSQKDIVAIDLYFGQMVI